MSDIQISAAQREAFAKMRRARGMEPLPDPEYVPPTGIPGRAIADDFVLIAARLAEIERETALALRGPAPDPEPEQPEWQHQKVSATFITGIDVGASPPATATWVVDGLGVGEAIPRLRHEPPALGMRRFPWVMPDAELQAATAITKCFAPEPIYEEAVPAPRFGGSNLRLLLRVDRVVMGGSEDYGGQTARFYGEFGGLPFKMRTDGRNYDVRIARPDSASDVWFSGLLLAARHGLGIADVSPLLLGTAQLFLLDLRQMSALRDRLSRAFPDIDQWWSIKSR